MTSSTETTYGPRSLSFARPRLIGDCSIERNIGNVDHDLEGMLPREIYEEAQLAEESGNKLAAAELYERATYFEKASILFEELGDIKRAYETAKTLRGYRADQLAARYGISDHEYTIILPLGGDHIEDIVMALETRFRPGATAEQIGFHGFQDKIVADIGMRDGRYVPMIRRLGAKKVYGIDPDKSELDKAVKMGVLDEDNAIPWGVEEVSDDYREMFDVAAIFNFIVDRNHEFRFMESVYQLLTENGEIVMTTAEPLLRDRGLVALRRYFRNVEVRSLWTDLEDSLDPYSAYPHRYLIIARRKKDF